MHDGIIGYITHEHRFTGDFLRALLSNNLCEAVVRGDENNQAALVDWVRFLYNEVPSACWGSPAKVDAWLEREASE